MHCSTRCWPPGVEKFSEHPASGQPSTRDKLSSFSWRKQVWTVQGGEGVYHLCPLPPTPSCLAPSNLFTQTCLTTRWLQEEDQAQWLCGEGGGDAQCKLCGWKWRGETKWGAHCRDVCRSTLQPYPELPEASWTATGKTPPAPSETLRMRTRRGHSQKMQFSSQLTWWGSTPTSPRTRACRSSGTLWTAADSDQSKSCQQIFWWICWCLSSPATSSSLNHLSGCRYRALP